MGKMKELDIELQDLRTEFFDSPASDQMSFDQFLIRKGKKNLSKLAASKRSRGGKIDKIYWVVLTTVGAVALMILETLLGML